MAKKYVVRLSEVERAELQAVVDGNKASKEKRRRAWILLKADQGEFGPAWTDERIAETFECSVRTVEKLRKSLVLEGFDGVLERTRKQQHPAWMRTFDGRAEARLIALAQSKPPEGRCRWTIRLLADKAVEMGIVDETSHNTVWQTLKKTNFNLTEK